jgi:hypothetical protein
MATPEHETETEGHLSAAKHAVEHALHEVSEGFVDRAVEQHERWEAAGERADQHHDDQTQPEPDASGAAERG